MYPSIRNNDTQQSCLATSGLNRVLRSPYKEFLFILGGVGGALILTTCLTLHVVARRPKLLLDDTRYLGQIREDNRGMCVSQFSSTLPCSHLFIKVLQMLVINIAHYCESNKPENGEHFRRW